jgi:DNA-binding beta-propeller fold protein YncE
MTSDDHRINVRQAIKTPLMTAMFKFQEAATVCTTGMKKGVRELYRLEEYVHDKMQFLTTNENNWKAVQLLVQKHAGLAPEKVKLDIGGRIFSTSKSLLLSYKDSFFEAMLGSGHWRPSKDGTYFVDRTPTYFETMLDYMRNGKFDNQISTWSTKRLEQLQEEFDFYQIAYPIDPHNSRYQGRFVRMWGQRGAMDGEFNSPRAVAVSNENEVYVIDALNFRIQVFDLQGRFQRKWKVPSGIPTALATGWGRVYLVGTDSHTINVVTYKGDFVSNWGTDEQFRFPSCIKCDTVNDVIYVADTHNNRIQTFNREHVLLQTMNMSDLMNLPDQLVLAKNILLIANRAGEVHVHHMQWDAGRTQLTSPLRYRWTLMTIKPCTLARSEEGEVYECEQNSNKMIVSNDDGVIVRQLTLPGPIDFKIWSVAFSTQGYMFIVDKLGNRIMQLN